MDEQTTRPSAGEMADLYAALATAQGQFQPIAKNRTVTIRPRDKAAYTFRYADLEAVLSATRPALSNNGLSVIQAIRQLDGAGPVLETILAHSGGGAISSITLLPRSDGGDIKNYGAAITYLRRYAYCAMLCVAADDDLDDNGQEPEGDEPEAVRQPSPRKQASTSSTSSTAAPAGNGEPMTAGMLKTVRAKLEASGKAEDDLLAHFGVGSIEALSRSQVNDVLDWLKA